MGIRPALVLKEENKKKILLIVGLEFSVSTTDSGYLLKNNLSKKGTLYRFIGHAEYKFLEYDE